jgi:hypothetical protein
MILIKLILAHLLGDFVFQPDSWVKAKEKKRIKSWQLYVHSFIHFVLINLLVWQTAFIKWAILLTFIHFVTDTIKLYFQKINTKRQWFIIDQVFHAIVIVFVWSRSQSIPLNLFAINNEKNLLLITLVFTLTQPVSVIVRHIISKWSPDTSAGHSGSLANAGNYIGILERLFVFTFVVTGNWEAIGFLLAAKSVFRFGDLKESKDRKLTEYVLIGTLLSFGFAVLTGLIYTNFPVK